ncbi:MAG: hypothetical protein CL729_00135 [Chloroflexi bacterium]|jgi:hypothetical protein|nr:hypothetical protein [Chloroflexota bacterium]|tara:strand:+ start:129 stop:548 length:420 start_codon:yes stop_codon:yes gene_type:complete
MRFNRSDLVGIIFAIVAPIGAMWLILTAFELWDYHDTPMLGAVLGGAAVHIALLAGVIGAFSRFIRSWDWLVGLGISLLACILTVIALQQIDQGDSIFANILKLVSVLIFLAINLNIVIQFVKNGIDPILVRRASVSEE